MLNNHGNHAPVMEIKNGCINKNLFLEKIPIQVYFWTIAVISKEHGTAKDK